MATKVTISLKAEAVAAFQRELAEVEAGQMQLAEDMSRMLMRQMELARKSRDLHLAMEKLLK